MTQENKMMDKKVSECVEVLKQLKNRLNKDIIFGEGYFEALQFAIAYLQEQPREEIDYWECPCGYRVSDVQYLNYNYDFGCPKCKTSFGKFKSIKKHYSQSKLEKVREILKTLIRDLWKAPDEDILDEALQQLTPLFEPLEKLDKEELSSVEEIYAFLTRWAEGNNCIPEMLGFRRKLAQAIRRQDWRGDVRKFKERIRYPR